MKNISFLFLCLLLFMVGSCGYSSDEINSFNRSIQSYLKKQKTPFAKSESGLYMNVIKKGTGREILLGDSIGVTYTGKLMNGKVFDQQKKIKYFAMRSVIDAWKEAVIGQKQGVELKIIVPPQLGYGQGGRDQIPENAILYFELKVEDVK